MAIRDRITVKTVKGDVIGLTVTRQGNSIDHTMPKRPTDLFRAAVLDKNGQETDERLVVPAEQVSYILFDREPKQKPK